MPQRRRLILTASALVPALVLIVSRVQGLFGLSEGGFGSGPAVSIKTDVGHDLLVVVVTLIITGLAVYFGVGGLHASRGAGAAFVLGWGAFALAATAGEMLLTQTARAVTWASYAPLNEGFRLTVPSFTSGYGILLGWLVALAVLIAFVRTRPQPAGELSLLRGALVLDVVSLWK